MSDEKVNHPAHYHPGPYEVIDVIKAWGLGFTLGNAVKYIARHGMKGDPVGDLRKARWYVTHALRELDRDFDVEERTVAALEEARQQLAAKLEASENESARIIVDLNNRLKLYDGGNTIHGSREKVLADEVEALKIQLANLKKERDEERANPLRVRDTLVDAQLEAVTKKLADRDILVEVMRGELAEARHEVEAARKIVSESGKATLAVANSRLALRCAKILETVDSCLEVFRRVPAVVEIRAYAAGERDS